MYWQYLFIRCVHTGASTLADQELEEVFVAA